MNFYNLIDLKTHLLNNIRRCVFVYLEPTLIEPLSMLAKQYFCMYD